MVSIPMGRRGRAKIQVPSLLYHNLRSRKIGPDGSIVGYPLSPKEKELEQLFPDPSPTGYVWLAQFPNYAGSDYITIDAHKLDAENLRYTGQAEGFLLHKGSIPASAIIQRSGSSGAQ